MTDRVRIVRLQYRRHLRRKKSFIRQPGQITGVSASGQVGSLSIQDSSSAVSVFGTGVVGIVLSGPSAVIVGVSCTGSANDVFPIPPPPTTRAPLLIPSQNGYPASLWLGSTNGN